MPSRGGGSFRHKLTLKKDTADTANAYGELVESSSIVATGIPAEIRTLTSDERRHAHAMEAGASHVVVVRNRTDITTDKWFLWGTRRLDIAGPAIDQMNKGGGNLEIPCREKV